MIVFTTADAPFFDDLPVKPDYISGDINLDDLPFCDYDEEEYDTPWEDDNVDFYF